MNKQKIETELSSMRGWDADEDRAKKLKTYAKKLGYTDDVTGDACKGDKILFARAKFTGSRKRPKFAGIEVVSGKIVNDSYGQSKQQHTFTIQTKGGEKLLIKGRNLYSIATFSKPRGDERQIQLTEKHQRGELARSQRQIRIEMRERYLI